MRSSIFILLLFSEMLFRLALILISLFHAIVADLTHPMFDLTCDEARKYMFNGEKKPFGRGAHKEVQNCIYFFKKKTKYFKKIIFNLITFA